MDPYAEREAAKYEHPIPSREYIMRLLEEGGVPMRLEDIAGAFALQDERDLEALRRRLRAMERDGQLIRNRRGGYGLVSKMDLVRGSVIGHPDGFGFLVPEDGSNDLFLSAREMQGILHGDRVVARVVGLDRRGRREGAVVEVLERNTQQVVGRFFLRAGIGFVQPDNKRLTQDILVPPDLRYGATDGQIVSVDLVEQPSRHRQAIGRVVEILGEQMAPGMEIDIAIRAHGLRQEWSPMVEAETQDLAAEVPEEAKAGRVDLRDMPLLTIDGEDSRDFDDAVYAEPVQGGWRLVVAIADVGHYVRPGTALDNEARERGNSVYFPNHVIPMLPEVLSNGLCSLNPDVDRLCMVCDMRIGARGELKAWEFYEGVMRSRARLTYKQVGAALFQGDKNTRERLGALLPQLEALQGVYLALRGARRKRGAIDFETDETAIEFGPGRKIERIVRVERNEAYKLIEECMLAANVCTAQFLLEHEIPTLYRVHGGPKAEKLADLRSFLGEFGLQLGGGEKPRARDYAKLLEQVLERPDARLIQTVMLRSLSQAVYAPDNIGHFGLAYEAYAHFTSPIRRYPDLLVHRAIRHLKSGGRPHSFRYGHSDMESFGEHCSRTERRADEATRDAVDWLKCEYMMDKVGEEFDGIITAVTGFGVFVQLDEVFVEGLVHITALSNDYYHFDPAKHRLVGERTHKVYRLADPLRVKVARVDLDDRKIDFELVADQADLTSRRKRRRGMRRQR